MEKEFKNPAEPSWETDTELSDDELDNVSGGAVNVGRPNSSTPIIKSGGSGGSGSSGPGTNTPASGGGGFTPMPTPKI